VRFDGKRFVAVPLRGQGDSSEDVARAICLGADGNLIVRSAEKTFRMRSGTFFEHLEPIPPFDPPVREIIETRDGQFWVGTQDSLLRAQNGSLVYVENYTQWITSFLEDRLGRLWIGSSFALFKYEGQTLTTYKFGNRDKGVEALAEDRDGTLWVGTRRGLYRLSGGTLTPVDRMKLLAREHITAILQDRIGSFWVGTDSEGLFRLADGIWSHFSAREGLTDNSILSLHEDREGSIWVGTKSGLDRFRDTKFLTFTTREGLVSDDTSTVIEGHDGSIYVFAEGGGLTRLKDGHTETYTVSNGLGSNYGGSLYSSSDGSIWIGTDMGLSKLKYGKIQTYTAQGQFLRRFIAAIAEDQDGSIIGSARRQLFRLRHGRFLPFTIAGQVTPVSQGVFTYVLYYDTNGTLWVGTERELFKFPRQSSQEPGRTGLRYEKFPIVDVKQIFDDQRGSLWLISKRPGLVRFRTQDGHITEYTTRCGLLADEISRILPDRHNNLWISSARGIFTVSRQELDDYAAGKIERIRSTAYGTPDGMKTTEASIPQHQPAGWRTRDGRLWFTTRRGLVVIDPEHIPHNNLIPQVLIEEVRVNEKLYPSIKAIAFSSGAKNVEIHYTALSLVVPDRVRFKYRLEGYDPDWVEARNRREAYYTHLSPGSYRFHVIACNDDGVWNEAGATWNFSIPPAFYQTNFFRLLCVASSAAFLGGLYLFRLRQIAREYDLRLEERVSERTRIARELHDTLLQSFHGLMFRMQAARNLLPLRPEDAGEALDSAIARTEQAIAEGRNAIQDLRSEPTTASDIAQLLETMGQELATSQHGRGDPAMFRLTVEGDHQALSPLLQDEVYRVAREVLTNAFQHARARQIEAEIRYDARAFRLRIRDDGAGIAPEVLRQGKRAGHWGLPGIHERAKEIGAQLDFWSEVGVGTEMQFTIPASVAYIKSDSARGFTLFPKKRATHAH
jgi:signal transduction histidine kinase/ligand-binding sensor domain-containing protein